MFSINSQAEDWQVQRKKPESEDFYKKKGIERKKQGPLLILNGEKEEVIKFIYFSST